MFQGPPKPVQFRNHQLVPGTVGHEQDLVQFRPAGKLSTGLIKVDLFATGRAKGIELGLGVLFTGGDAPIADSHGSMLYREQA